MEQKHQLIMQERKTKQTATMCCHTGENWYFTPQSDSKSIPSQKNLFKKNPTLTQNLTQAL